MARTWRPLFRASLVLLAVLGIATFPAQSSAAEWFVESAPNAGPVVKLGENPLEDHLTGLSCPGQTSCFASGYVVVPGEASYAFPEHWNGTSWTLQAGVEENFGTNLAGISCDSTTDCTAVGSQTKGSELATLAWHWDGTKWSAQAPVDPKGSTNSRLTAVSCPAQGSCFATGYIVFSGVEYAFLEHWNGTTWTQQTSPENFGTNLAGISCDSTTDCTAVGSQTKGSELATLAWHWDGTKWSAEQPLTPGGSGELADVSCDSSRCVTVGSTEAITTAPPIVSPARSTLAERTLDEERSPSGWDYGLTKRCMKTTGHPGETNYYQDVTECEGEKTRRFWLADNESQTTEDHSGSCPGVPSRAFPYNGAESPVGIEWLGEPGHWTVDMTINQVKKPSEYCGPEYFTFFSLQDQSSEAVNPEDSVEGGPLPDPRHLFTSYKMSFTDYLSTLEGQRSRLIVGALAYWAGEGHLLEVDLSCKGEEGHGCGVGNEPTTLPSTPWGQFEYAELDGRWWGLTVPDNGAEREVRIPWGYLFRYAVAQGWFPPIPAEAATIGVYPAIEVMGHGSSNLFVSDYRVESE
jgi:hypothetical protein